MSDKIFINYRRGDDSGFAQALFIRLEQAFSPSDLFMDIDSIPPGEDFVSLLESQIAQCDVLLAVIGKGWLDAKDERGGRRLDDPDDFVRIEIASALKQGKRVIPVLLHDARMPRPEQLPPELAPFTRRHAVRLTHERFRADTEGLIKSLQRPRDDITAAPDKESEAAIGGPVPPPAAISPIGDAGRRRADLEASRASASVSTATTPVAEKVSGPRLGIAARIENLADRYEAINFGLISLLAAFLLLFGSYMAGVLDVEYKPLHKQVGFGWAPNWSFNYLVLFVAYNCLLCAFANRIKEILELFVTQRIVIRNDGRPVTWDDMLSDWRHHLNGIAPILWTFNIGVPFVCIKQWFDDCYQPLSQTSLLGRAVEWTNIAIVQPDTTSTKAELLFTGVSYSYMAISLWIYLFVLLYAATFAWYINRLSRGVTGFRLMFRAEQLPNLLRDSGRRIFVFAFLSFISALTMRLQTSYLQSSESNVIEFMFSTELRFLFDGNITPAELSGSHQGVGTPPWPSWPVFIYAAVMFGFAFSMLHAAYNGARNYYLAHIDSEPWRHAVDARFDEQEISEIRAHRFWRSVAPDFGHWMVISFLMLASMALPTVGSLFLSALLYAVGLLVISWLKPPARPA